MHHTVAVARFLFLHMFLCWYSKLFYHDLGLFSCQLNSDPKFCWPLPSPLVTKKQVNCIRIINHVLNPKGLLYTYPVKIAEAILALRRKMFADARRFADKQERDRHKYEVM